MINESTGDARTAEIANWLGHWLAERLGTNPEAVAAASSIQAEFDIDSLRALELCLELEEELGQPVSVWIFAEHDNLSDLASYLASKDLEPKPAIDAPQANLPQSSCHVTPLQRLVDQPNNKSMRALFERLMARSDRFDYNLSVDAMDKNRYMLVGGEEVVNFGHDSYLGLDFHPQVIDAIRDALPSWGSHNGASRSFHSVRLAREAEARLASWLGVEDTLIFPSVTMANHGVLPALCQRGTILMVDRLAHATIHEAAKIASHDGVHVEQIDIGTWLSDGPKTPLVERQRLLTTDGVYSMTGCVSPLRELQRSANEHEAVLYVDDAHATGLLGPRGQGAAYECLGSVQDIVLVGSLSKAFSCLGAFVSCTPEMRELLELRATTYIFTGPVPPPYLAGVIAVCDILESQEYAVLRRHLEQLVAHLVAGLTSVGAKPLSGRLPIVSIPIGQESATTAAAGKLLQQGYYVQPAIYPAVPPQQGVLRILVNANHSFEQIDGLVDAVVRSRTLPTEQS